MFNIYKKLLLFAALFVPWATQAQDLVDYQFRTGVDSDTTVWIDLDDPEELFDYEYDDDASDITDLGFTFPFCGASYTQFWVNTNGVFSFGQTPASGTLSGQFTSSYITTGLPKIVGVGRDIGTCDDGYIRYQLTGTAPHRVFVCEYKMGYTYSAYEADVTWQIQLHEDSSKIIIVYGDAPLTIPSGYQTGMCSESDEILIIDPDSNSVVMASGSYATTYSTWHGARRYYEFVPIMPTCPRPDFPSLVEATTDELTVSWPSVANANSYLVSINNETPVSVNDTAVTISNLFPGTFYNVSVRSICSAQDTSRPRTSRMLTLCAPIPSAALPYEESFETWEANSTGGVGVWEVDNPCWNYGSNYTSNYHYPYVSTSYAHTGTKSMYMYKAGTAYYAYLNLPEFEDTVQNLMLSFWVRNAYGNSAYSFEVGVMTDINDESTFIPTHLVYPTEVNVWQRKELNFVGYTGPQGRMTLRVPTTVSYCYTYLDDLRVEVLPTCGHVENLTVDASTTTNASISWDTSVIGIYTGAHIEILPEGDSVWQTFTTDETSIMLTDLLPGTTYDVRVASLCTDDDTSTFEYVQFRTFGFACAEADSSTLVIDTIGMDLSQISGVPVNSAWGNTFCQSIYTAEELIAAGFPSTGGTITDITYTWTQNSSYAKEFSIYMTSTSDSVFTAASSSNWIPTGAGALVYTGDHAINTVGAVTYHLSSAFTWDGHSNICITTTMNQPAGSSHSSSGFYGYSSNTAYTRTMYSYRDASAYDGANPAGASTNIITSTYRPNVILQSLDCITLSTCAAPGAWADYIGGDTVTVAWIPGAEENAWTLYYRLKSDSVATLAGTTTENYYDFTGLLAGQKYVFYVYPECSNEFFSEVEVRSECGKITTVPYSENFDGESAGSSSTPELFPCYARCYTSMGMSYYYPYVYNYASYAHSGTQSLYWYCTNTDSYGGTSRGIVLPQVDVSALRIDSLMFTFWARSSSTSYSPVFVVGVYDDPTVDSTFVPVDTVYLESSTDYQFVEVMLNSYIGNGSYIALRDVSTSSFYAYVDDIGLTYIPPCPHVGRAHMVSRTTSSIELDWTERGQATSWSVEYGPTGFTQGSGTTVAVSTLPVTFNGLNSNTKYDFYIVPVCDDDPEVAMVTFTTLPVPVSLPINIDFADATENASFALDNGNNVNKWYIGSGAGNGDNAALYISSDNGATPSYSNTAIAVDYAYIDVIIPDTGDYAYSFDWMCYGESTYDYIRALLIPASESLEGSGTLPTGLSYQATPAGWISLDGGEKLNLVNSWQTQIGAVNIPVAGTYHLTFVWRNDGSAGSTPPAIIDNVQMKVFNCRWPATATIIPTADSVSMSWIPGGDESQWVVNFDGVEYVVNNPELVVNGLMPNTDYQATIMSVCDDGDSSFAIRYHIHTPCYPVSLPYYQNFDSVTSGIPDCWEFTMTNGSYSTASYYPAVYAGNNVSSPNSLRLYGNAYTMLPPVDVPLDSVMLTFSVLNTSPQYYALQVGVMEGDVFVPVSTINVTQTSVHTPQTVFFENYTGDSRIIAFNNYYATSSTTGYSYHYIDDIVIDYIPSCAPVRDVYAYMQQQTSIEIDWTDRVQVSQWEIRYGVDDNTMTTIFTNEHPVEIANLDSLTTYQFYIRPICSAADSGMWWGPVLINTSMCDNSYAASTGSTPMSTSYIVPLNNFYNYTLTETIIDSAELAGSGEISALGVNYVYTTASTRKNNVDIYLQPTDLSSFASTASMVPLDTNTAVLVYSGPMNCEYGWNFFTFDTLYTWDGHSNLLLIVDDNSGSYDGSTYVFSMTSGTGAGNKTIYYYSDSYNPDVFDPTTFSGTMGLMGTRAMMQLVSCDVSRCSAPRTHYADNITYESATINWISDGSNFEVSYKAVSDAVWPDATPVAGTNLTLTGLTFETTYQYRIRLLCEEGVTSDWAIGTFTTAELPCFAPTGLETTDLGYSAVTFGWTSGVTATEWNLHVWNTQYDTNITVSATTATLGGLGQHTDYYAAVQALCGNGIVESDYSDTIPFTTLTCEPVTGVTASNIQQTSAQVSWTGTGVKYSIEYGPQGFGQGTGTTINDITGNSYTLTGLEPDEVYDVYVRNYCTNADYSVWSAAATFTTPVGIDGVSGANVRIYPNPTTDATTITLSGVSGEVTIAIVDMNGRTVATETMTCEGDCAKTMEVSGLASGAYFVRISGDNLNKVQKLIVK